MHIRQMIGLAGMAGWAALCGAGALADGHAASPADRGIAEAFALADVNDDGFVNVDEYVGYIVGVVDAMSHDAQGRLRPADVPNVDMARFAAIDRDGDGLLTIGEVVADRMIIFFEADTNNDGVLTLDELMAHEAAHGEG